MTKLKSFLIVLILACTLVSFAKVSSSSKYFTLISATKQSWVSGIAGGAGGAGINYYFTIKLKSTFSGFWGIAWVGNEYFPINTVNANPMKQSLTVAGDTLVLRVVKYTVQPKNRPTDPDHAMKNHTDPPYPYKGAALIEYTVGKTSYYFVVKKVEELKKILGQ